MQSNTTTVAANYDNGTPGWDPMGYPLPEDFLDGEPTHVLTTIAMLCVQPAPKLVEPHPQAIVMLALYAAGGAVTLTTEQFRKLERTINQYISACAEERFIGTRNFEFAQYVRNRAVERAKRDAII